jgi:Flp pilus assembly protein TadG
MSNRILGQGIEQEKVGGTRPSTTTTEHEHVEPTPSRRGFARARELRARGERGAALVEFALILVLFFVLIFGMIEFGSDYNNYIAVRNGTREGARLGIVNDLNNAPACKINGATVTPPATITSATPALDATNALICKTKDRIGLSSSTVKVKVVVPPSATIGSSLQLCASYPVNSITGLVSSFVAGKTLVSNVTMRLEQVPTFTSLTETGTAC